jgi:hypothetical protein
MRRKAYLIIVIYLLLSYSYRAEGQFTPAEIAQRQELEEFLSTAKIIRFEAIGEGITKPIRLFLKKDDIEKSGVWKNPHGYQAGYIEGWQYEIAAYKMDKLLGLNMIPPTVERKFKGKRGSLQLWIDHEHSLLTIMEQKIKIPPAEYDHFNKTKYLTRAFDSLIANEDRTQQNILFTKDWRRILIDHSRSFRSSNEFTEKLLFGKSAEERPKPFRQLPRTFVDKIKALDFEAIKESAGYYLNDKEIKAILMRKKLLLAEIEEMIKEKGEDKVLY